MLRRDPLLKKGPPVRVHVEPEGEHGSAETDRAGAGFVVARAGWDRQGAVAGCSRNVRHKGSGGQAQALLAKRDFDLILSDLRMPDLDGPALHDWVQRERPHLAARIAFVTGDTLGAEAVRFLTRAGRPFIEKPFTRASVKRLLTGATEGQAR